MTISRGQMNRQLYMGGGIMNAVPREQYGLGSVFKGVKKAVKGATKTVKKIASSDLGKAAITGAVLFGIPGMGATGGLGGGLLGRASFGGAAPGVFGLGGIGNLFGASTIGNLGESASGFGKIAKFAGLAGVAGFLTSTLGMSQGQAKEELTRDPSKYLELYYRNLNPPTADTNSEQYEQEVRDFVSTNTSEYKAEGGRIGYGDGTMSPDEYFSGKEKYMKQKQMEDMIREYERYMRDKNMKRDEVAMGGRMKYAMGDTASQNAMQAAGIEGLPMRQNPKGVQELDLRDNGGFIPPVGIKEKEDDIPAMLSNNEFVFTADAVRGMGDGDVELGAQRMYDQMKTLEKGGRV